MGGGAGPQANEGETARTLMYTSIHSVRSSSHSIPARGWGIYREGQDVLQP